VNPTQNQPSFSLFWTAMCVSRNGANRPRLPGQSEIRIESPFSIGNLPAQAIILGQSR
jgi:hypothetical protein